MEVLSRKKGALLRFLFMYCYNALFSNHVHEQYSAFCSYTFHDKWVHILQAPLHKVACFWTGSGFPELQYISERKDSSQLLTRMHEFTVFGESVM